MATALILTENAAEAFHAQQVIGDLFVRVRACNTVAGTRAEMSMCPPDLVIAFGLEGFTSEPALAVAELFTESTPVMLMSSGLRAVGCEDPVRSVRVDPPLTTTSLLTAIQDLGLIDIVAQSSLPSHLRRSAN